MQKSKTGKFSIFSSLDVKLWFLMSWDELTQFSVESRRVKLKMWATRLNLDLSLKSQLETQLDDQSNWMIKDCCSFYSDNFAFILHALAWTNQCLSNQDCISRQ